jgi:hypothetical protein
MDQEKAKLRLKHSRYALRNANSTCFSGSVYTAGEASALEEASAAATFSRPRKLALLWRELGRSVIVSSIG